METRSEQLFAKAQKLAPGGVHSPVRAFRAVQGSPLFIERGAGSKIYDVDGKEYVDFCMSWGALSLGHAHPAVVSAVQEQVQKGTHYGTPTEKSLLLAELALDFIKAFDRIRFVNSGTEAVMTSVRLARGITCRNKIVKLDGSYHGHVDSLLVNAGSGLITQGISSSIGIPEATVADTLVIPFHNEEALEKVFAEHGQDIACVILEPILANNGLFEFEQSHMQKIRKMCTDNCTLLIFDEVITGFRVHPGGAKAYYDIQPDLCTYGKVIGGGMPVGAIAGPAQFMEQLAPTGPVYQAGTLSANPITMTAGYASLKAIREFDMYNKVEKLGQYLDHKIQELKESGYKIAYKRIAGIFWLCPATDTLPLSPNEIGEAQSLEYKRIHRPILDRGIYLSPSVYEVAFLSLAHTESDIDSLIQALKDVG